MKRLLIINDKTGWILAVLPFDKAYVSPWGVEHWLFPNLWTMHGEIA